MNKLKNYKNQKLNQKGFGVVEVLLIIIALTLIVGVGVYVFRSNNSKNESDKTASSANSVEKKDAVSTAKLSTSTSETQAQPVKELVEYPDQVMITQKSDVSKLTDASQSFKDYMASLVKDKPVYITGCDQPQTVAVRKIYKDQFAIGGIGDCGGAYQIWKKTDNQWALAIGGQDVPICSDIKKYSIPHQIYDKCADETKNYEIIPNTL